MRLKLKRHVQSEVDATAVFLVLHIYRHNDKFINKLRKTSLWSVWCNCRYFFFIIAGEKNPKSYSTNNHRFFFFVAHQHSDKQNSTPVATCHSCLFALMGLAQGTTSCLPSDHSEKPPRVSSRKRSCKCSSAGFTSSRWVKRFEEEVIHTLGTPSPLPPLQQLRTRPPRWRVNETTGRILIPAGRGRRDGAGAGARTDTACELWVCAARRCVETSLCTLTFTFNMPTVLRATEERLEWPR